MLVKENKDPAHSLEMQHILIICVPACASLCACKPARVGQGEQGQGHSLRAHTSNSQTTCSSMVGACLCVQACACCQQMLATHHASSWPYDSECLRMRRAQGCAHAKHVHLRAHKNGAASKGLVELPVCPPLVIISDLQCCATVHPAQNWRNHTACGWPGGLDPS